MSGLAVLMQYVLNTCIFCTIEEVFTKCCNTVTLSVIHLITKNCPVVLFLAHILCRTFLQALTWFPFYVKTTLLEAVIQAVTMKIKRINKSAQIINFLTYYSESKVDNNQ